MLTSLYAVLLGVIEGVTEFLPISSTGHMILAANALSITNTDFLKSFEIIIQLGAVLAVVLLYWKKLVLNKKIFGRVAVAFVPTALVGLFVYPFVKAQLLGNMRVVIWSLLVGGVILIAFELFQKNKKQVVDTTKEIEAISYPQAVGIGLFQAIAIVPGVSRSAATIVGGLLMGISRQAIVEFSFMLAVPTMAAATGLDIIKSGHSFTGQESLVLCIGFVTAFVSALIAIKFLLRFVKNHTFIPFGIYRIVIAVAFLLYLVY